MEFDRRVQVHRYKPGQQSPDFGSGYLVAPRLVLTAGHILGDESSPGQGLVTVCRPDTGSLEVPATVRWYRKDETVDAALVEVDNSNDWEVPGSLCDIRIRPPQRWGYLIGTRPHPVAVAGFPRMQKDRTDGRRLDEQLTGEIRPGSGSLAGRYEVSSTDPVVPLPLGSQGTPWSGMSGAALLSNGLLCGVVRQDRQATGGTRLTATPLQAILADDDFRVLLAEHTGWDPIVEPVEPTGLLAPAALERDLRSPAMLLRPDAEAVDFRGREVELSSLLRWCNQDREAFSVRVLTGPGGQGKTRLARHLTEALRQQGWVTGHLRANLTDTPTSGLDLRSLDTALPLMLVVDYAETRPRLVRDLIEQLRTSPHRSRLFLLARSDGEWRTDTLGATALTCELLATAPVIELGPLLPRSDPITARSTAFTRATADLARLLQDIPHYSEVHWSVLATTMRTLDDLTDPRYDSVLTLHMMALTTLLQHGPAPVSATPGEPTEATLLRHEQRYWEETAKAPAFRLDTLRTTTLRRAVAVAAACGATNQAEAEATALRIPGLPPGKSLDTAEWLRALYPPGPDHYWGSLQPDRVAEYHVSDMLAVNDTPVPGLIADGSARQQAQIITVLARAATAHYNAHRTYASEKVLQTLDTALDTAAPYAGALENAIRALPQTSHVLSHLTCRLTYELCEIQHQLALEQPQTFEPHFAEGLSNLGVRLSDVGRQDEAVTVTEQAVEIWRRLAADNPTTHEPGLAAALGNLGVNLWDVERWDEALTVTEQAVEIRRRLAVDNPAAYERSLATSLAHLSFCLSDVQRWDEALPAAEEAVRIYYRLKMQDPAIYEPEFAMSLLYLGSCLWDAKRADEAQGVYEQAVRALRQLATINPASHERALADSLSMLAQVHLAAERWTEALSAIEQAVEIRRRLSVSNPGLYEPVLAESLLDLGSCLLGVEQCGEALTATEEAVAITRRMAANNPADNEPAFGTALTYLSVCLSQMGRREEGLSVAKQVVEVRQRSAVHDLTDYESDLATSLTNLSVYLLHMGRNQEALSVSQLAVARWRRLSTMSPEMFNEDLNDAMANQAEILVELGRTAEAEETRRRHTT